MEKLGELVEHLDVYVAVLVNTIIENKISSDSVNDPGR